METILIPGVEPQMEWNVCPKEETESWIEIVENSFYSRMEKKNKPLTIEHRNEALDMAEFRYQDLSYS